MAVLMDASMADSKVSPKAGKKAVWKGWSWAEWLGGHLVVSMVVCWVGLMDEWRAGERGCCLVENWVWMRVVVLGGHLVERTVGMRVAWWVDNWVEMTVVVWGSLWA
jgi:hypothetical protein